MKLKYCVAALGMSVASTLAASNVCGSVKIESGDDSNVKNDSIALQHLDEAVVMAVKAPKNAPFAVSSIGKKEMSDFARTGQELPFLFARTPGVIAWSDNGIGTGAAYMTMRGSKDSRINVTLDGVSLNSPEDQCVFWANMNSYASFLSGAQIQRGVGSSTNGDGAFGGTIALTSKTPNVKPQLELSASAGSFNTWVFGGNFSTGLFAKDHLALDGAYHETRTDGYMHGTDGRSGSYYGSLTYYSTDRNFKVSYKNFGNFEKTGLAWNGVESGELLAWNYGGMGTGIYGFKDLYKAGLGRYNSLVEKLNDDADPSKGTSPITLKDGTVWKRTTDNFVQNHNVLNFSWNIDQHFTTAITAHYTYGNGYYDDLKPNCKTKKFGLPKLELSDGSIMEKTDFIRQKGLTQHCYGVQWNVNYTSNKLDFIMGTSLQNFSCNHWGYLTYMPSEMRDYLVGQGVNKHGMPLMGTGKHANDYHYYDSDADKNDGQVFAKASWHATDFIDIFGDVQYRNVHYFTNGYNDKFIGTLLNQKLNVKEDYNFFNPKFGVSFHKNGHNAYASYALSHREPERDNFTDNGNYPFPKPEELNDIEFGYGFNNRLFHLNLGGYYMLYHNQFVMTGETSDIGEMLTTNIKRSYRLGLELSAGVNVTNWLSLEANAALSQNKIKDFTEYAEDWDNVNTGIQIFHYDNSTLAFSPSAIVNGFADFHYRGLNATWHTSFVSKQYLDNTECNQRSLPKFTRTDVALSYNLKVADKGLKNIVFGVNLNNIFNAHYAISGWVYSAICASAGNPNDNRYTQIGYFPQAAFSALGSITLKF